MKDKPFISFILPAYQAESFIYNNLSRFTKYCDESDLKSEIIAVNDGSTDRTHEAIESFIRDHKNNSLIKFVNLDKNCGKGFAIKKAIEIAEGQYVVFTDCDLQYSFKNISDLVNALVNGNKKIVIANRMCKGSVYKIKSENLTYIYIRHTAGRIYNWFVNVFTHLDIEDTQAGLKGFDRKTAEFIFKKMTVSGFTFDVDILVCARENNIEIAYIPIEFNYDEEMSTMNFIKQVVIMFFDLLRIFLKRVTGYYRK